jgi:site-specific DNA recombinase
MRSAVMRHIFRRYVALGSVRILKQELDAHGIVSKVMISAAGRRWGGVSLARGALYAMLKNRIYIGEIQHKDQHYPGEHTAIIDRPLWDAAQQRLAGNAIERATGAGAKSPSLLAGLLFDAGGHRLIPTHAVKGGRRYRYYVSKALITGGRDDAPDGYRVPAPEIEALVGDRIHLFLADPAAIFEAIRTGAPHPAEQSRLLDRACGLAGQWPGLLPARLRLLLHTLIRHIELHTDRVEVQLLPSQVRAALGGDLADRHPAADIADGETPITLSIPAQPKRVGMSVRMLIDGGRAGSKIAPDPSLVRLLVKAHTL